MDFEKDKLLPYIKKLAEAKRGAEIKKTAFLGGGLYGLVFEISYADGGVEILKAFKFKSMLGSEAEALKLLKEASPLKVPEVFYTHYATEKLPIDALAMEKIDGVNAMNLKSFLFYSKKKRERFAEIITDALFKIQQTTGEKYGFISDNENEKMYATWLEFYTEIAEGVYEQAKILCSEGKLSLKICSLIEKGIRNIEFILGEDTGKPCILHCDFYLMNIMVNKKTFEPTGIIDPCFAMWGDREYDLWHLDAWTGKRFRLYDTYKKKFKTSKNVDLKCAFYSLISEVFHHAKSGCYSKTLYSGVVKNIKKQFKKHGLS